MSNNNFGYGVLTDTDVVQIENSLQMLVDSFNGKCHVNLLEIGIHKGYTSRAVDNYIKKIGLKDYTYWAIDTSSSKPFENCKLILGKSEENFMNVPESLHWVFIDACHCVNHVMLDFLNYGYRVEKNGLLLFHDTSPSAQGNHYQKHGPQIPEFCIAISTAFDKLDIFNRKDWELISNEYDETREFGGIAIFRKSLERRKTIYYYSRDGQDRWVIELLKNKENGYFVDIGASNGISGNNTYALEKHLNWDGICVEPNPNLRAFPTLKENRKCICDNGCLYSSKINVDFVNRGRKIGGSGIYFDCASDSIHYLVEQKKHSTIKIMTTTLLDLLNKYRSPKIIDYLSIDAEGAEWEILKNFDFTQYTFLTITVENNYNKNDYKNCQKEKNKRDNIRDLLGKNGYILKKELDFGEDWFIHKSIL